MFVYRCSEFCQDLDDFLEDVQMGWNKHFLCQKFEKKLLMCMTFQPKACLPSPIYSCYMYVTYRDGRLQQNSWDGLVPWETFRTFRVQWVEQPLSGPSNTYFDLWGNLMFAFTFWGFSKCCNLGCSLVINIWDIYIYIHNMFFHLANGQPLNF